MTKSGEERVKLTVSGHINRGVLISDDGFDTEAYNVDNDSSSAINGAAFSTSLVPLARRFSSHAATESTHESSKRR